LRTIALAALLLLSPLAEKTGRAQELTDSLLLRFESYSAWCSPEKVYLHYDRSCYTAGETIWFRGWVQEASALSLLPPSNFLYAELLNESGEAVVRVKIKRTDDAFPGCIELPYSLETGFYTIRAYTLWQLNSPDDYLFHDRIRIIGGQKKEDVPKSSSSDIAISFWPESGRYFAGQSSVIGFKVVDGLGRSVDFSGFLVSDEGKILEPVLTIHDGMGAFSFLPEKGKTYSIMDASGKKYPLPLPAEEGALLQLHIRQGRYYISALGYGGGVASLLVRDAAELRPVSNIDLDGKVSTFVIEKNVFRPGINHFLIVDSLGQIMAERLFFVRDDQAPLCKLEITTFLPAPRALAKAVVSLNKPDGTPLDGNCSISVVRGALKNWQQSDGISSYMGLSSELKENINKPYYYFDPEIDEKDRDAALDLLMMIQGWRFYDLEKIAGKGDFRIRHRRELSQEIRGSVSRGHSSKIPENYSFSFMIPKQKMMHYLKVERGRYFIIDSLDFQENTEMLINIGQLPRGKRYFPNWDGDPVAGSYIYKPAPGFSAESRLASPTMSDLASGETLEAALIVASYGEDDVLVFGRAYREDLTTYKDWTLIEYLNVTKPMFEYDGDNMYNRNKRRSTSFSDDSDSDSGDEEEEDDRGKVKLIVEDNEAAWWSYDQVRLEDLRSLSISTQADPIYGGDGGVVHITMKLGGIQRYYDRDPSLLYFVPLGYQVPQYFESPRYDQGENGGYDTRNTILWAPEVVIDGGRATIEFCNSDTPDFPYVIRIEGMSADGRPFSRHCIVNPE
ncbi:MAG: hypothetical protein J6Y45_00110, partial [Bacteroidales bacterium]|nr:hypothetical protein [Bacteroidales bacterium]